MTPGCRVGISLKMGRWRSSPVKTVHLVEGIILIRSIVRIGRDVLEVSDQLGPG